MNQPCGQTRYSTRVLIVNLNMYLPMVDYYLGSSAIILFRVNKKTGASILEKVLEKVALKIYNSPLPPSPPSKTFVMKSFIGDFVIS